MKKKFNFFIALISLVVLCVNFMYACSPSTNWDYRPAYTVRFNDNYQGDYAKVEVEDGKTVALPTEPKRTGFTFKGWFIESNENSAKEFDATKPIKSNLTVFAKWEKVASTSIVTLKFMNYRDADATFSVGNGAKFAPPKAPIYDADGMYGFVNWYTDKACTQIFDFDTAVSSDITLYAGWAQEKAYVKLDYNYPGCPDASSLIVTLGQTANITITPTREQYEFGGWFLDRVGGELFNASAPITQDTVLYAHWLRSEYTIKFNSNGAAFDDNLQIEYVVKKLTSIEEIANNVRQGMTFEGHDFEGWYTAKKDPESEVPLGSEDLVDLTSVNSDFTLFAGWKLSEYTVSFDYNYDGAPQAPESQKINYGKKVNEIPDPVREKYMFGGWFKEKTFENQFTFDMPVSENMTLYVKWIEDTVTQQNVMVSYFYNVGAGNIKHAEKSIVFNASADTDAPATPTVNNYMFAGWYEDATLTKAFNMKRNLTENITVYAKMLKKYTFEAEATDLTEKIGQGTSTNSFEEGMIMTASFIEGGNVSNGYFVNQLYYSGASLDFEITASKAVDDAMLYLRVSSESYEFFTTKEENGKKCNYLSDEQFKIVVNDSWAGGEPNTWLSYGGLYMPMANTSEKEDLSKNKTPFKDCFIISGLKLKEGRNVITLYIDNNNNHGGTFHSEAPMVDCMYIYSSTELTTYDHKFYERENVTRG